MVSLAIVLSVLLRYTDPDYPFGIFWPLCCLFFSDRRILITSLWYLQAFLLVANSVLSHDNGAKHHTPNPTTYKHVIMLITDIIRH
jgi:hypothetical protein